MPALRSPVSRKFPRAAGLAPAVRTAGTSPAARGTWPGLHSTGWLLVLGLALLGPAVGADEPRPLTAEQTARLQERDRLLDEAQKLFGTLKDEQGIAKLEEALK